MTPKPKTGALAAKTAETHHLAEREAIYRKLFDLATERRYMAPVVEPPSIQVHHKGLVFDKARSLNSQGFAPSRIGGAK